MRRRVGVLMLSAVLMSNGAGCASWRQVTVEPAALASEPQEVRVTRRDGTRITLVEPRIAADSIAGSVHGERLALPLDDVSRLAVPSASKSKWEAGSTFVGAAVAAIAIWLAIVAVSN